MKVSLFIILAVFFQRGPAGVARYEGNTCPDTAGWTRSGTLDAERWCDRGWFVQRVDLGAWGPPPGGEQDRYEQTLATFTAVDQSFVEWRMLTSGDRS